MKKAVFGFALCLLLFCITACSNTIHFESNEEMLNHLEGMWFAEEEKSYYIFQDGQIYKSSDMMYSSEIQRILSDVLRYGGINTWSYQNFANVSKRISLENCLINKNADATLLPKKGKIIFNEGERLEEHILITKDSVLLETYDSESSTLLTKISNTLDFSCEHFSALFNETKENYTASATLFFPLPKTYLNALKKLHPNINNFVLVSQEDDSIIYSVDGKLTNSAASLLIDDKSVTFSQGMPVKGQGSPFLVLYEPGYDLDLFISDRRYTRLSDLLRYVEPVLETFPGALSTSDLLSRFEKEQTVSGGARIFETTSNGITYEIIQSTDNKTTVIYIKVADSLRIPETKAPNNSNFVDNNESAAPTDSTNSTESTNPAESGNTSSNSNSSDNTQSPGSATEPTADTQAPTETEPTATESATKDKLNFSFSDPSCFSTPLTIEWEIPYQCTYAANYLFEEDGTCYMLLGAPFDVVCKGIGTYSVDGDTVTFHIILDDGTEIEYTYLFNFDAGTVTQLSEEGFAFYHERNDVFKLTEAKDLSLDIYKEAFPSAEDIG